MAQEIQSILEKLLKSVLEKVAPILKAETQKILNVPELVESMRNELDIANDFLKKTEERAERADDRTKNRVWELRELVFKIEDYLDDYEMLLERDENERKQRVNELFQGASTIVVGFESKHGIARKIGRVKNAMEKIKDGKSYEESIFTHVQDDDELDSEDEITAKNGKGKKEQDPSLYPLYKDEEELVRFKERKKEVIDKLDLEMKSYAKGQLLLAVWGEPGVGKTTLVQKVFEDEQVRKYFSCFAWITATKRYNKVDLLKSLYNQLTKPTSAAGNTSQGSTNAKNSSAGSASSAASSTTENEVTITNRLRSYLEKNHDKNRYLVVLDNVSEMGELSNIIKAALVPSQSEGGRILITTKSEGIANYWKTTSSHGETYKLQVLSEEDSMTLFNNKVFGNNKECPSNLTDLRAKIVPECDGLPFLIENVGAVFSTKEKWIELYHNFQINHLSPKDRRVFMSCYNDMPYRLKSCFLYLCMFPKGYQFERMRIIRLWIAEGFVEANRHFSSEEAAKEYLSELVERGMIRCLKRDETERNRIFQLANMWQHIMLPKLADLSFCQVLQEENLFRTNNNRCRRLSISDENLKNFVIPPSVRSILSFTHPTNFPLSWPPPYRESAFRLKVLDLQNANFDTVPNQLGYLHNLRYLCLRNTKVKQLPQTIDGVYNLETLDLKQTFITELPKGINRLKKLRHLLVYHYHLPQEDSSTNVEENNQTLATTTRNDDDDDVDNSTIYDRVKKLLCFLVCCCRNEDEENTRNRTTLRKTTENKRMVVPVKVNEGMFENFEQLQKLSFVDGSSSYFVEGLGKLKQLRRLGIINLKQNPNKNFCKALEGLKELRALSIKSEDMIDLMEVKTPPQFLERLYLEGPLKGNSLPECILKLKHLVKVRFMKSGFVSGYDLVTLLKGQEFLLVLEIDKYDGEFLDFGDDGFKNLRVFRIQYLNRLMRIQAGNAALPKLEKFVFQRWLPLEFFYDKNKEFLVQFIDRIPSQIYNACPILHRMRIDEISQN